LSLTAEGGFESSTFTQCLSWPSRFWSVGASLSETIFDAGLRRATVQQYVAAYNSDLAAYRQTVLTAFQQVEDGLAEVRILSKEIQQEQQAVDSAQTFLKLEQSRYDTGIDPYIDVLTAQTTVLTDQQTLNALQVEQMTYAVALVEALGGGWDTSQLPSTQQVTEKPPKSDTTVEQ
jgi:outer membrane protein TolC